MKTLHGWVPGTAVIAVLCSSIATIALDPRRMSERKARALLAQVRKADRVEVLDTWAGLGPWSSERYVLRREGARSKEGTAVPASILDRFLGMLAAAPLVSGPYEPGLDHSDDYPHFAMTIGAGEDPIVFFSDSQGADRVPWAVQIQGKRYVISSDAPARALDLVRAYLPRPRSAAEPGPRPRVPPAGRPRPEESESDELGRAAERGDVGEVQQLLSNGADVNGLLDGGATTPLIAAVTRRQLEVARMLLSAGADPVAVTRLGEDALSGAVNAGANDVLSLLIETAHRAGAGPSRYRRAMVAAAASGRAETLRALLAAGADPERGDDESGESPLHVAAACGRTELVALLIASGARPDAPDHRGIPPLVEAARNGHVEVVRALLEHGARSGLQEGLSAACSAGRTEVARALMGAGAAVDGVGPNGITPLMHAAAGSPKPEVVRDLLDSGAAVNAVDSSGRTALFIAAMSGANSPARTVADAKAVVRMLLDAGADPEIRNRQGRSVVDVLQSTPSAGSSEILAIIREGARP